MSWKFSTLIKIVLDRGGLNKLSYFKIWVLVDKGLIKSLRGAKMPIRTIPIGVDEQIINSFNEKNDQWILVKKIKETRF